MLQFRITIYPLHIRNTILFVANPQHKYSVAHLQRCDFATHNWRTMASAHLTCTTFPSLICSGTKIQNDTSRKCNIDYPYDKRYFLRLDKELDGVDVLQQRMDQLNLYNIDTNKFQNRKEASILRTTLWLANVLNVPSEFCDLPDKDLHTKKTAYLVVGDMPHDNLTSYNPPHLKCHSPSFLFGGHQGDDKTLPITNQPYHCDQTSIIMNGSEFSVSNNPHLQDHLRPFSVIIPLEDCRDVVTVTSNGLREHRILKGEAFILEGDTTHAGRTTTAAVDPQKQSYHTSLHLHFCSTKHQLNTDEFEIDIEAVSLYSPQLLPRLGEKQQLCALKPMCVNLCEACTFLFDYHSPNCLSRFHNTLCCVFTTLLFRNTVIYLILCCGFAT